MWAGGFFINGEEENRSELDIDLSYDQILGKIEVYYYTKRSTRMYVASSYFSTD